MFSIIKKELQSFFYTLFAYFIAALFMLIFTYMFNNGIADIDSSTYYFSFTNVFYNVMLFFLFIIPILTMRTFSDERKYGTEVLLMTSPNNTFKIVIGKFLANEVVFLFMLACSSVFPIVTALNGSVAASQLFCAYLGFLCWGTMCITIGMLMSSFTDNSIIAAILGEVSMLVMLYIDDFSRTAFISRIPWLQKVLYAFAAQPKFEYFSQSLIRLSDIVFFISAVILFLGWTIISIEKRRWNRG